MTFDGIYSIVMLIYTFINITNSLHIYLFTMYNIQLLRSIIMPASNMLLRPSFESTLPSQAMFWASSICVANSSIVLSQFLTYSLHVCINIFWCSLLLIQQFPCSLPYGTDG